MNANEVQINDMVAIRRTNEKNFREGLVLDIQTINTFGFESHIALVAFRKGKENVNLDNCQIQLTFRDEVAA